MPITGRIVRWTCPEGCGYFREWHENALHLRSGVEHPIYGLISVEGLVAHDISTHSCGLYGLAHSKATAARMARQEVPEMYPVVGTPLYPPHVPGARVGPVRTRTRAGKRNGRAVRPVFPRGKDG